MKTKNLNNKTMDQNVYNLRRKVIDLYAIGAESSKRMLRVFKR